MRDWFTVPEGETDEAHITPAGWLAYRLGRLGIAPEEHTVPPTMLLTFQNAIAEQFVHETHAQPARREFFDQTEMPLWQGTLGGAPVAIAKLPVGASRSVAVLELLIECGARTFLMAGYAGSLTPAAPIGAVVIPTDALREEGTSYHYLPPDADPLPDPELVRALIAAANARGVLPEVGKVWTTDAIYREMGWKVRQYGAAGILAVEMEFSALLALAAVRGVRIGAILAISDELFHPWVPGFHADALVIGARQAANIALDVAATVNAEAAGGQ